jgi:CheY-like chemotaxis protein/DNA-binding XRE family transcriptional regulator
MSNRGTVVGENKSVGNVKKHFGAAVRLRRNHLGISQEELAGRAGLHRTYISDVERGARNVSLESIHRLADALAIPASVLFLEPEQVGSGVLIHNSTLSPDELVEILIVEDSVADAELAMQALRNMRATNRFYVVRNGREALDFLFCKGEYAHRKRSDRPHVILLDLTAPKVEGMEVLRQIKADSRTRTIPVVVMINSNQERDAAASQKLGADAYIIKPDFQNLGGVVPRLSSQSAHLKRTPVGST